MISIHAYIRLHTHACICSVDSYSDFKGKPGNANASYSRTKPSASLSKAWMSRIIPRTPAPICKLHRARRCRRHCPLASESSKLPGARLFMAQVCYILLLQRPCFSNRFSVRRPSALNGRPRLHIHARHWPRAARVYHRDATSTPRQGSGECGASLPNPRGAKPTNPSPSNHAAYNPP